jgi:hypothetical protein
MKRLLPYVALAGALSLLLVRHSTVQAYPKPSLNKIAWELDFKHSTPSRIVVNVPGSPAPKAYWYMPFTVTNNTKEEQQFLPEIELVDENGKAHRSDRNLPKEVFNAIKVREGKKLMQPLREVSGRLLVGPDQAKDSVAIWPEPMERMGTFRVYVSGLSGEAVWYKDGKETPMSKADWVKTKPEDAGMILRKTLELEFQVPGDEFFQGRDVVNDKGEKWVMR